MKIIEDTLAIPTYNDMYIISVHIFIPYRNMVLLLYDMTHRVAYQSIYSVLEKCPCMVQKLDAPIIGAKSNELMR